MALSYDAVPVVVEEAGSWLGAILGTWKLNVSGHQGTPCSQSLVWVFI